MLLASCFLQRKGKTELWSSVGNANNEYTSPGSVRDASFSNESCFSNSFDNVSGIQNSNVYNVLRCLSNTGLILTQQRFTIAREVIIHTELLVGTTNTQENYLIGPELFDELMIYAARSDNLVNLPGLTGGFLVNAMIKHLEERNISRGLLKPLIAEFQRREFESQRDAAGQSSMPEPITALFLRDEDSDAVAINEEDAAALVRRGSIPVGIALAEGPAPGVRDYLRPTASTIRSPKIFDPYPERLHDDVQKILPLCPYIWPNEEDPVRRPSSKPRGAYKRKSSATPTKRTREEEEAMVFGKRLFIADYEAKVAERRTEARQRRDHEVDRRDHRGYGTGGSDPSVERKDREKERREKEVTDARAAKQLVVGALNVAPATEERETVLYNDLNTELSRKIHVGPSPFPEIQNLRERKAFADVAKKTIEAVTAIDRMTYMYERRIRVITEDHTTTKEHQDALAAEKKRADQARRALESANSEVKLLCDEVAKLTDDAAAERERHSVELAQWKDSSKYVVEQSRAGKAWLKRGMMSSAVSR
ncbi:hypothetical protein ISN45_Aa05g010830 [Arabidopsis thaliana x Arabidopsis arenosa]|uniref:Uncharacterized protein n=1 Tax=Arabidopsis thaliana x Arabidopsis arenosa TaxID=1240361 RepID=A0A8T1ZMM4_9BRAS|nr:hypothetical protein ISN45_Aa05g010830 [Arabidopsis thaliana x Arabidopsis arenosa]